MKTDQVEAITRSAKFTFSVKSNILPWKNTGFCFHPALISLLFNFLLDIDECAASNITGSEETGSLSACHHICTNVEGSFQCSCKNGYALMYDKKQCKG